MEEASHGRDCGRGVQKRLLCGLRKRCCCPSCGVSVGAHWERAAGPGQEQPRDVWRLEEPFFLIIIIIIVTTVPQ